MIFCISAITPQNVSARRRPDVWQTRSMKPPPRCKTCRTVDEKAASPTRGKCLSPASRSSLFTASDKERLRSPVSCILRSNGLNHKRAQRILCATSPSDLLISCFPRRSKVSKKKIPFSNTIKCIIAFKPGVKGSGAGYYRFKYISVRELNTVNTLPVHDLSAVNDYILTN